MQLSFRALKNLALQVHVAKDNSILGDDFYVKRDFLPFSVNVKLFFELFVIREKANYLGVKVFSEEV